MADWPHQTTFLPERSLTSLPGVARGALPLLCSLLRSLSLLLLPLEHMLFAAEECTAHTHAPQQGKGNVDVTREVALGWDRCESSDLWDKDDLAVERV
eukprot:1159363-Pelagomonas_calceolata.AAC.11